MGAGDRSLEYDQLPKLERKFAPYESDAIKEREQTRAHIESC